MNLDGCRDEEFEMKGEQSQELNWKAEELKIEIVGELKSVENWENESVSKLKKLKYKESLL